MKRYLCWLLMLVLVLGMIPVGVAAATLQSIQVVTQPTLDYREGESLDLSTGVLQLNYSDGTADTVALSEATVTGFDSSKPGTQTLQVTYQGCSTTLDVYVWVKTPVSLQISQLPNTTEYLEGKDQLDVTGGKLLLTYDNGTSEEVDMTPAMISGFPNSYPGPQVLEVRYGKLSCSFEVQILPKSLVAIEMYDHPHKHTYLEETEQLDVTGGKLTLIYNNDTQQQIDLTSDMVSGFDNTRLGTQTLTVRYAGLTTSFDVEVWAKSMIRLELNRLPDTTVYTEGVGVLDLTGGSVRLWYDNNTTELLDMAQCQVTGFDNTAIGLQTLTLTYKGFHLTFDVEIREKELTGIVVVAPTKTEYLVGRDTLDLSGGKLILQFSNGTTEELDLANAAVTGFRNDRVGRQELKVSYGGFETAFCVTVTDKVLQRIAVTTLPVTEYLEGIGQLNLDGVLTLYYNNGMTEEIELSEATVTGFDIHQVGRQTLTVAYMGLTTTYQVIVEAGILSYIEVTTPPEKTIYELGEELDLTGGIVTVYYNTGANYQIPLSQCNVDYYDSNMLGLQYVEVEFGGEYTDFEVQVVSHLHKYNAVVTEPTCQSAGYTTYTCSCGRSYTEPIPAKGHEMHPQPAQAPTVDVSGWTEHYACAHCDHKEGYEELYYYDGLFVANGASYRNWADALATGDTTIELLNNVWVNDFEIPVGITLDLNGKILSADHTASFGDIIDTLGGGAVATQNLLTTGNSYLPLKDGEVYRFFAYELVSLGVKGSGAKVKFGFALNFADIAAYRLLAGEADLDVTMTLTWSEGSTEFAFGAALVKAYAQLHLDNPGRQAAMILNVTGADTLASGSELSLIPAVLAVGGQVSVVSEVITYTVL